MPAPMGDKFYGLYRGYVLDNKDPKNQGRIKVAVPGVYGNDVKTGEPMESTWALPKFNTAGATWGVEFIPPVKNPDGTPVTVWIEFESGDQKKPVWSGCFLKVDQLVEKLKPIYSDKSVPHGGYCIVTPRQNYMFINDNDDGAIYELADRFGNKITMTEEGIVVLDKNGNSITMNSGGISVFSPIAYRENAPTINMN